MEFEFHCCEREHLRVESKKLWSLFRWSLAVVVETVLQALFGLIIFTKQRKFCWSLCA